MVSAKAFSSGKEATLRISVCNSQRWCVTTRRALRLAAAKTRNAIVRKTATPMVVFFPPPEKARRA